MCKFKNIPCALNFEIKHSEFFYRSFRTCNMILNMDFTINKFFGSNRPKLHFQNNLFISFRDIVLINPICKF